VADLYRTLHPAVLAALQHVVGAAHSHGKTVSICGELAGDPRAVPLLLAMGFDQLSMNAANLPRVKKILTSISMDNAQTLLESISTLWTADEVGAKVDDLLHSLDLQRYVRGKGDAAIDADGGRSAS
jgi:Phosphoenolpyruvate-protein kinase (PTS system EI component in bacteria)